MDDIQRVLTSLHQKFTMKATGPPCGDKGGSSALCGSRQGIVEVPTSGYIMPRAEAVKTPVTPGDEKDETARC